ncbi:DUF305 domain-containing protein [Oxalobacteraceae bacterium R-40]|uniref:DUF305 domain-containing protein n=1 Tax=Keguizhuia sedimenti TaxID=3064264 RepID=A0ABU1BT61_9BURK|nr:DUF305 domain-containing protein [Oxalobacteraceae bacterium R-40]
MPTVKHATLLLVSLLMSTSVYAQSSASGMSHHGSGASHMSGDMKHEEMKHGDMKHESANASKMPFDHQFLDTMSMHHAHGIQMAQLAQERATHDELKQMAKKMHDDQQEDIKKMQAMKEQWYAGKGDAMNMQMPGMKESLQSHDKNMEKLKAAKDEQFDTMFVAMMSKHHTDGRKMANAALKKAEHQDVKEMAKKIADSQKKDNAEMAAMQKEWKQAKK